MDNSEEIIGGTTEEQRTPKDDTQDPTEPENSDTTDEEKSEIVEQEQNGSPDEDFKREVENLRTELAQQKNRTENFISQMRELYVLYPDADINTLSDEIWQSVKSGIPIAAAYALNARRAEVVKQRAEEANRQNKEKCIGGIKGNGDNGYFSPSEVRGMSQEEVRNNYTKIIDSMNHWN